MSDNNRWWLSWEPRALSLLRFVTGLAFLDHGTAKLIPAMPMFAHKWKRGWSFALAFNHRTSIGISADGRGRCRR